jgi:signal transduction histidine kinase
MRRHVDRELTRARLHEKRGTQVRATNLGAMVGKIVRAVNRMPVGEGLKWQVEIPTDLTVCMDDGDLAELLGNLFDNAAKWARRDIMIRAVVPSHSHVWLTIEDDGPGVPAEALAQLGNRGVRLDEQAPGNGLGLAIVRDILAAYGGDMTFSKRPVGGLRVQVDLPACAPAFPAQT